MKKILTLLLLLSPLISKADHWTRKADFPAGARDAAYGFSIGNKAYVGGGVDSNYSVMFNDLWEYDPATNSWTKKANLPVTGRCTAASFAINNKGYICTGQDSLHSGSNDLWEYDPNTDTWAQKASIPGNAKEYPVAFVIGNLGYVGTGWDGTATNDLYSYNPTTNSWNSIASIPGYYSDGTAFTVLSKAYVTGLYSYSPDKCNTTLWEYNQATNSWTTKANFPDIARTDAASFSLNALGYFGVGDKVLPGTNKLCNDFWQYNPITDTWTQKASLPSTTRDETTYFAINNKGYICFGGENPNAELWEYTPDSTSDVHEIKYQAIAVQLFPNPFSATATIYFGRDLQNAELHISDIYGKEIESYKNINGRKFILNRNYLNPGMYFYQLYENGILIVKDKMIVQ